MLRKEQNMQDNENIEHQNFIMANIDQKCRKRGCMFQVRLIWSL
jgi:hypothetical protein